MKTALIISDQLMIITYILLKPLCILQLKDKEEKKSKAGDTADLMIKKFMSKPSSSSSSSSTSAPTLHGHGPSPLIEDKSKIHRDIIGAGDVNTSKKNKVGDRFKDGSYEDSSGAMANFTNDYDDDDDGMGDDSDDEGTKGRGTSGPKSLKAVLSGESGQRIGQGDRADRGSGMNRAARRAAASANNL